MVSGGPAELRTFSSAVVQVQDRAGFCRFPWHLGEISLRAREAAGTLFVNPRSNFENGDGAGNCGLDRVGSDCEMTRPAHQIGRPCVLPVANQGEIDYEQDIGYSREQ